MEEILYCPFEQTKKSKKNDGSGYGKFNDRLPIVYNAKYFITKNLAVKHGIVNASEVLLYGFCTQDNTIVKMNDQTCEIVLIEMPKYLIVEHVIIYVNKTSAYKHCYFLFKFFFSLNYKKKFILNYSFF